MVAAREAGVPPWELARAPSYWMHAILAFMDAEHHARKMAEKRQGRKGRM
jgi:hypothetical protein